MTNLDDAKRNAFGRSRGLREDLRDPVLAEVDKALEWMHSEDLRPVSVNLYAAGVEWHVPLDGLFVQEIS